jgi:hypothetical protein
LPFHIFKLEMALQINTYKNIYWIGFHFDNKEFVIGENHNIYFHLCRDSGGVQHPLSKKKKIIIIIIIIIIWSATHYKTKWSRVQLAI